MEASEPTSTPARPPSPSPSRTRGWVVGKVSGAPVILAPSWFLAAAVLTVVFAPTVSRLAPDLGAQTYVVSFAFVLLLFVSVFLHEVAHALVARARGQKVTELAVTLWGGHTAYTGSSSRPLDGFLIAVVGPVTNLALAVAFWFGFHSQTTSTVPALLLYAAAVSNAFVGIFNLLPGLPLDGGQILESGVWAATGSRERGTVAAGWVGRLVAAGVVVWALVVPLLRGDEPDLMTVAWSALIGAFLWSGAGQALRVGRSRAAVAALSVRGLVAPAVVVEIGLSVADVGAAVAAAGGPHVTAVLVDDDGAPVAVVDPEAAAAVPPEVAVRTPVVAVAVPVPAESVDIGLAGPPMLTELARVGQDAKVVVVTEAGAVAGVLEIRRVVAALRDARGR